ncbi:hypothetical protein ACTQV0_02365 [Selenomonas montiformis]|uniref:hypothetical protein n=1 Tax=Selenomonas montiformis TaxID=2652285 RepID=UPI003F8B6FC2
MKPLLFSAAALAAACFLLPGARCLAASPQITGAEAVAEVAGDGEHVSRVVLSYDFPIDAASVTPDDYEVTGRTITRAYPVEGQDPASAAPKTGSYVVLELAPLPLVDSSVDAHPEDGPIAQRNAMGHMGPTLGSHGNPQPLPVMEAQVVQVGLVKTTAGLLCAPSASQKTTSVRELVVEDFQQAIFQDPAQGGAALAYNLYIPKNYNPEKRYPLVLFMHDAGAVSSDVKTTLVQGLGAITFSSPEWQAEHPCFVLAPQYDTIIVNDLYQHGPELERTMHLVKALTQQYAIDTNRIYNTGQSMGGMTSIEMDTAYPDVFAGSYLVACKWAESSASALARQHLWIVSSEGDAGAMPSMRAILKDIEASGVTVRRQTISADRPEADINRDAASLITPTCSIYQTIYEGGSHRSTWQHAYRMTPALAWLFTQKRTH